MRVYLDNAATTPVDERVLEAMTPFFTNTYGNPSSIHSHGREARSLLEQARKKVADLLNASPSEIFFTSGGTEADNMSLCSSIESGGIKHVITSKVEHHAVLHTLEHLHHRGIIELDFVELDERGNVNLDYLERWLSTHPNSLVSLMHANNEIGNITDIGVVGELCDAHDSIFHSDTVQTVGHYAHNLSELKIHCMVGSAHKFNGPKGIGFLYLNGEHKIKPYILGGAQERNMRGGTENIAGIIGLARALEIAYDEMDDHKRHIEG